MAHTDPRHDSIRRTLREHGLAPTAQRLRIGGMVLDQPQHFSAEALYERVKAGDNPVSRATVYNTLGLFLRKGLLRQVLVEPGKVFYDSNLAPHHHLYDVESGELVDIDAGDIEIGALPEMPRDLEIEGVDVVVRVRRPAQR